MIKFTRTIIESHHPEAEITFMLLVSIIISTSSLKSVSICYWQQTDKMLLRFQGQISKWREGRSGGRSTDRYNIRVEFLLVNFFFHISFNASLGVRVKLSRCNNIRNIKSYFHPRIQHLVTQTPRPRHLIQFFAPCSFLVFLLRSPLSLSLFLDYSTCATHPKVGRDTRTEVKNKYCYGRHFIVSYFSLRHHFSPFVNSDLLSLNNIGKVQRPSVPFIITW